MKPKLLLLLSILLLTSCGLIPPKWIRYNGGKQAVAKAYSLSKKTFVYSNLIDTTAIYIAINYYVTTDSYGNILIGEHRKYDYMRFSNSGLMFLRTRILENPTTKIANSMEDGQYCFYMVKDSTIKMESYNHDTRVFEYWYGKIQPNGDIQFYKRKGRPWGTYTGKINYLYKKTPANLTTPIVFPTEDWENEYYY